jgi:hypothetical protein
MTESKTFKRDWCMAIGGGLVMRPVELPKPTRKRPGKAK